MTISPSMTGSIHQTTGRRERMGTRAMFLAAGLAMAVWAPLVPFARDRVGIDDGSLGLVLLCLGLGSIVAMPLTGIMTNRFGCRAVLSIAAVAVVAITPMLALANDIVTLALSLAIFGASVGSLDVAINIQAVMVEKDNGRNMMSGFHGLFSLGGIIGAGGVSLLLRAGLTPILATIMIGAIILGLLFSARSGLLPYGNREGEGASLFAIPKGIVILIGLLCFILFLGEGAVLDWSALFLIRSYGIDPALAGFGYAAFAIAMTFGRLCGDHIIKFLGETLVLTGGSIVAAAGFFLSVFSPTALFSFVGFFLVGLGASNVVPVLFTAAGNQTRMPSSLAIASVTTIGYAGVLMGPGAIGGIAQIWNLGGGFLLISAGLLLVAITGPLTLRR